MDALLATGGTSRAACDLLAGMGADVVEVAILIELEFLKGRARLAPFEVRSVLKFCPKALKWYLYVRARILPDRRTYYGRQAEIPDWHVSRRNHCRQPGGRQVGTRSGGGPRRLHRANPGNILHRAAAHRPRPDRA
ncbi:MAG: hypothetical protein MK222_04720 [Candidatus Poseidoniia archaeon]|nr:hypothetical protein [Candidatus Poseidoniia archaeon]